MNRCYVTRMIVFCMLSGAPLIARAQSLRERMADSLCVCFTALQATQTNNQEAVLKEFEGKCMRQIPRDKFRTEIETLMDTISGERTTQKESRVGEAAVEQSMLQMVETCDAFYQSMNTLRNIMVEKADVEKEREKIKQLSPRIDSTHKRSDYLKRGICYFLIGDYKRAEVDLNMAAGPGKSYERAYMVRAFLYEKTGNYEKALADYNEYKKIKKSKDPIVELMIAVGERAVREAQKDKR